MGIIHRSAIVSAAAFAPLVFVTAFSAGVSNAVNAVGEPCSIRRPTPVWRRRCHRRRRRRHPRGTEISPRASG